MRRFLVLFSMLVLVLGILSTDAEAARFGGGRSFGMTRSVPMGNTFRSAPRSSFAAAPQSSGRRWLGPLAGFVAGGLLASLFMGHGLGSGLLSWLLVGGIIFFVWNLWTRYRAQNSFSMPFTGPQPQPTAFRPATGHEYVAEPVSTQPTNFDETSFLRFAKATFIRLQAAYDTKNMHDLREFASPEIIGEIQMQWQERGNAANETEVISIDAVLQDVTQESDATIATVLFSGSVREEAGGQPVAIKEAWHFSENVSDARWVVVGIQQVQ